MSKKAARPSARPRRKTCRLCKAKLRPHELAEEICDVCLKRAAVRV